MAYRNRNRGPRRVFAGASFKTKRLLKSARRTASKHRGKAKTLTTVAMALGGYLLYDKFIKK